MEKSDGTSWIVRELNRAEAAGAMFYLNDKAYTGEDSEYLQFVLEQSHHNYMAGYIGDAEGRVTEVHVHRICDQTSSGAVSPGMADREMAGRRMPEYKTTDYNAAGHKRARYKKARYKNGW